MEKGSIGSTVWDYIIRAAYFVVAGIIFRAFYVFNNKLKDAKEIKKIIEKAEERHKLRIEEITKDFQTKIDTIKIDFFAFKNEMMKQLDKRDERIERFLERVIRVEEKQKFIKYIKKRG